VNFSHFGTEANVRQARRVVPHLRAKKPANGAESATTMTPGPEEAAAQRPAWHQAWIPASVHPLEPISPDTDVAVSTKRLHGWVVGGGLLTAALVDSAESAWCDRQSEWIQKISVTTPERGLFGRGDHRSILRRHCLTTSTHPVPNSAATTINFRRVPTVDTSKPVHHAANIPLPGFESFRDHFHFRKGGREKSGGIDFSYLLRMIHDSLCQRPEPALWSSGGKIGLSRWRIIPDAESSAG